MDCVTAVRIWDHWVFLVFALSPCPAPLYLFALSWPALDLDVWTKSLSQFSFCFLFFHAICCSLMLLLSSVLCSHTLVAPMIIFPFFFSPSSFSRLSFPPLASFLHPSLQTLYSLSLIPAFASPCRWVCAPAVSHRRTSAETNTDAFKCLTSENNQDLVLCGQLVLLLFENRFSARTHRWVYSGFIEDKCCQIILMIADHQDGKM